MRALTVKPGTPNSIQLDTVAPPPESDGSVLVRALALGICGTDREIVAGDYGWAPEGHDRLILGHESLGRVEEAPDDCGFAKGDLVAGIVRRPDPVPCPACAAGVWDMCRNGQYTEHGIKQRDGFCAERYRLDPGFAVRLDPKLGRVGVLMEPASILAKAWEHIEAIGGRSRTWAPRGCWASQTWHSEGKSSVLQTISRRPPASKRSAEAMLEAASETLPSTAMSSVRALTRRANPARASATCSIQ